MEVILEQDHSRRDFMRGAAVLASGALIGATSCTPPVAEELPYAKESDFIDKQRALYTPWGANGKLAVVGGYGDSSSLVFSQDGMEIIGIPFPAQRYPIDVSPRLATSFRIDSNDGTQAWYEDANRDLVEKPYDGVLLNVQTQYITAGPDNLLNLDPADPLYVQSARYRQSFAELITGLKTRQEVTGKKIGVVLFSPFVLMAEEGPYFEQNSILPDALRQTAEEFEDLATASNTDTFKIFVNRDTADSVANDLDTGGYELAVQRYAAMNGWPVKLHIGPLGGPAYSASVKGSRDQLDEFLYAA